MRLGMRGGTDDGAMTMGMKLFSLRLKMILEDQACDVTANGRRTKVKRHRGRQPMRRGPL
jgi:hypothetical protein